MTYAKAKADVEAMIDASSTSITIQHATQGTDGFYGRLVTVGTGTTVKALLVPVDVKDPSVRAGDAAVSVKASVDVREGDRITIGTQAYEATNVDQEDLFGTVTHKTVTLAAVRES